VVSYDNIFKHLGEMPDSYIIFYSKQGLLGFYLFKQPTTINGLYQKLGNQIAFFVFLFLFVFFSDSFTDSLIVFKRFVTK